MIGRSHIVLLASYNEGMNTKLFEAASKLSAQELAHDRKAFFGSILGTLNHLIVADTIWLKRFATHPTAFAALDPVRELPILSSLDAMPFDDLAAWFGHRQMLDNVIKRWAAELSEADLNHVLHYANTKGVVFERRVGDLLLHFFNHQTHHRGQVTTLLSQAGVDVGVTDLLTLVADESMA